jgi:arabinose-5-phosphate isomerase
MVISVTCSLANQMSRLAHLAVCLPLQRELCPFDLAPVTSTAIQMIFGDTLAVAIMNAKGVTRDEYSMNHPAGRIGKRLMLTVSSVMLTGDDLPIVEDQQVLAALPILTAKACGCLLVVSPTDKQLLGIFTDGDLRRAVQASGGMGLQQLLSDFMTTSFKSIGPDAMAIDALQVCYTPWPAPIGLECICHHGEHDATPEQCHKCCLSYFSSLQAVSGCHVFVGILTRGIRVLACLV